MFDPETAIVVTGAAGELGRSVVTRLASERAVVIALDLAPEMAECGQQRFIGGVDLAEPDQVIGALHRALPEQKLFGLVNVAGGFAWELLDGGSIETWDRMYRLNLRTAVVCSQVCLPLLRRQEGSIVNIGAQAAFRAGAGMAAYTSSKSGVARLTEGLAAEEKDSGVRVNAVLPSTIDTLANRREMPGADAAAWVSPNAIAEVVAFLLSPRAGAVSGACIEVAHSQQWPAD